MLQGTLIPEGSDAVSQFEGIGGRLNSSLHLDLTLLVTGWIFFGSVTDNSVCISLTFRRYFILYAMTIAFRFKIV